MVRRGWRLPVTGSASALLAGLLGACAVATPIEVESIGSGFGLLAAIDLPSVDPGQLHRGQFDAALRRELAKRSIRVDTAAPLVADYAVALRDAQTGLAQPQSSGADITWDSRPRRDRALDACKALRLRATLVLLSRAQGGVAYRGEAEADGCTATAPDFDRLAQALVEDALASGNR